MSKKGNQPTTPELLERVVKHSQYLEQQIGQAKLEAAQVASKIDQLVGQHTMALQLIDFINGNNSDTIPPSETTTKAKE